MNTNSTTVSNPFVKQNANTGSIQSNPFITNANNNAKPNPFVIQTSTPTSSITTPVGITIPAASAVQNPFA